MENIQEIYINLDDSGKLSNKEIVCVYGVLFLLLKNKRTNLLHNINQ